jgi:hypothetical protein
MDEHADEHADEQSTPAQIPSRIYPPLLKLKTCALEHNAMLAQLNKRRDDATTQLHDAVNHPAHYTAHPSGVECIAITEHMGFCLGNAVKYIWRADLKHDDALEDLRKARWYLDREIARREGSNSAG